MYQRGTISHSAHLNRAKALVQIQRVTSYEVCLSWSHYKFLLWQIQLVPL